MKFSIFTSICITLLNLNMINAQEIITTAGNSSVTTNISLSWAIGEVLSETYISANNTLTQGFHQGNFTVTNLDENQMEGMKIKVFPNPVSSKINLVFDTYIETEKLSYVLYNINGTVLDQEKIQNKKTEISFENKSPALYFLKVYKNNEELGAFKIIKN